MRCIPTILCIAAFLLLLPEAGTVCSAQMTEEKVISFPEGKTFDFGDLTLADGPQKCSFTFKNISGEPIQIFNVISSCGCTKPEWTRDAVAPGKSGTIDITFSNDQGPFPFDKTLTTYVSNVKRPVLLHVRGVVHEKNLPLSQRFPVHIGAAGFRTLDFQIKYIDQGGAKSDRMQIANLSGKKMTIRPVNTSDGLSLKTIPSTVEPHSTATLSFSVDTRKMKTQKWGKERFTTQFEVNGKEYPEIFSVEAYIRDDFSAMSEADIEAAPVAESERSYFEYGIVAPGAKVTASFKIRNTGKTNLIIRKIDCDNKDTAPLTRCPLTIRPGGSATIKASVDTRSLRGETLSVLTLVTNSPKRPAINLFITGIVNE